MQTTARFVLFGLAGKSVGRRLFHGIFDKIWLEARQRWGRVSWELGHVDLADSPQIACISLWNLWIGSGPIFDPNRDE